MTNSQTHSDAFLKEMKEKLEDELVRLERSLERITNKKEPADKTDAVFPDYGEGEDEAAMEVADFENSISLEYEIEKGLRDVKAALNRIEEGTYGIDKYTGELITEARLRARPTSTTSVESKKTLTQEL